MIVQKSWIAVLVCVLCQSGAAMAQRPDPAIGSNWPNGAGSTAVGGGNGDRTTFRDASGRSLGTSVQQGNRTVFRDSSGRSIGSSDFSGSRTTFRDASGRPVQSATNSQNRTTLRSSNGAVLGSSSPSGNQTQFRDSSGKSIGSALRNNGRSTFRDSSGRFVGSANRNQKSEIDSASLSLKKRFCRIDFLISPNHCKSRPSSCGCKLELLALQREKKNLLSDANSKLHSCSCYYFMTIEEVKPYRRFDEGSLVSPGHARVLRFARGSFCRFERSRALGRSTRLLQTSRWYLRE